MRRIYLAVLTLVIAITFALQVSAQGTSNGVGNGYSNGQQNGMTNGAGNGYNNGQANGMANGTGNGAPNTPAGSDMVLKGSKIGSNVYVGSANGGVLKTVPPANAPVQDQNVSVHLGASNNGFDRNTVKNLYSVAAPTRRVTTEKKSKPKR